MGTSTQLLLRERNFFFVKEKKEFQPFYYPPI